MSSVAALDSIVVAANGESQIYRSTNLGGTWNTVSVEPGITPPIERVAVINTIMYAGCDQVNVIFQSTNRGVTWQRMQVPLFNASVKSFVGDGQRVFAGLSGGGVIGKLEPTGQWVVMNNGLTNQDVNALCLTSSNLWSGTWGGGTFRLSLPTGIMPQPGSGIPTNYVLAQNYPNPFNPRTTIRFSIPHSGLAKLQVFDLLGKEVATLVDEPLQAGTYTADWNPSSAASGVYVYRLRAGGFIESRKLVLLR